MRSRFKNLIIIGNGFDCWQKLPSSYGCFYEYYRAHIDALMAEMHIGYIDSEKRISPIDLIYGSPTDPATLPADFFSDFENNLCHMDDQLINLYFGRTDEDLARLQQAVDDAKNLMREIFCRWVLSIPVSAADSGFRFSEDCYIINFNYTDTVEKRFCADASRICHIHGDAGRPASIVVGHTVHPEKPLDQTAFAEVIRPRDEEKGIPRVKGLYAVENALYETDKHLWDRWDDLCIAMNRAGVHIEDIEQIYVVGQSFNAVDYPYFEFLDSATRCGCIFEALTARAKINVGLLQALLTEDEIAAERLEALILLNFQYACHHRDRLIGEEVDLFPELKEEGEYEYDEALAKDAVEQRFYFEQANRTAQKLKALAGDRLPEGCNSVLGYYAYVGAHDARRKNPTWHISYYTEDDRKRIKNAMKRLHQKNYRLYSSIADCLAPFRL